MRRRTTFALTFAAALTAAGAAKADCCNDFWSCAAAVATRGLTCEVENIIDSVKKLSATVQNLMNTLSSKASDVTGDAQNSVTQAANDMNSAAAQASSQVTSAANQAHVLANPTLANRSAVSGAQMVGLGGGTPTNGGSGNPGTPVNGGSGGPGGAVGRSAAPPMAYAKAADPGSVKSALSRGDSYLQDLSSRQNGLRAEVTNATAGAVACVPQHVINAQQMVTTVAIQPLQLLANSLQDLLAHPEHIFDPSAQIDADIQNIQNSVSALFDKMTAEITTEANGRLETVHGTLDVMQDEAFVARSIADAMQRVANSQSQADLDALNKLLPNAGASARTVRGAQLPAGVFGPKDAVVSAYARTQPQNIAATVRHKAEVVEIVNGWAGIKAQKATPASVNPAHVQRIDPEFQRLRGKPVPEIQRQKQFWIDEARRRFANDPKTLQKVIEYIEAHARG